MKRIYKKTVIEYVNGTQNKRIIQYPLMYGEMPSNKTTIIKDFDTYFHTAFYTTVQKKHSAFFNKPLLKVEQENKKCLVIVKKNFTEYKRITVYTPYRGEVGYQLFKKMKFDDFVEWIKDNK